MASYVFWASLLIRVPTNTMTKTEVLRLWFQRGRKRAFIGSTPLVLITLTVAAYKANISARETAFMPGTGLTYEDKMHCHVNVPPQSNQSKGSEEKHTECQEACISFLSGAQNLRPYPRDGPQMKGPELND